MRLGGFGAASVLCRNDRNLAESIPVTPAMDRIEVAVRRHFVTLNPDESLANTVGKP
jgi:hypothetical protein